MKAPGVSVIITAFDVASYIAVAVQSAMDALPEDAEIIVVDDGSRDMTPALLGALTESFAGRAQIRPLTFSQNTIGGTATAANFGMDHATGEIVVFLDGDDWVIPHALRRALDRMRADKLDLLVTDCSEYWNDTGAYTKYPEAHLWDQLKLVGDDASRRGLLLKMAPFPWRKIYRRGFLEAANVRFPVGDYFFEDNPFHWDAVLKAGSWGWHHEVTHVHRMARAGQSLDRKGPAYLKIFDHFDTMNRLVSTIDNSAARRRGLLDWLLKHILWCAGQVTPREWNDLYELAVPRIVLFEAGLFWAAIRSTEFSAVDIRKLVALALADRMGFLREFRAG